MTKRMAGANEQMRDFNNNNNNKNGQKSILVIATKSKGCSL